MTVIAVRKDPDHLTMTLDAEFDATPERVWQLWADPRQLERWWGPPTYPATFTTHDLAPGSRVEYHMTGPEGDQPRGFWDIVEVDPPRSLVFRDGFANEDGSVNTDLPTNEVRVTIAGLGGNPWVLSTSVPDLDPGPGTGIGAVVDNSASALDFDATVEFVADIPTDGSGNFIPLNGVASGSQTNSSFTGAFYTKTVP